MEKLEVVLTGTVENINQQRITFNNKGKKLEFWMVKEDVDNITTSQEVEVTLIIDGDDEDFGQLKGYIKKDAYDFVMQFTMVFGIGPKSADSICTHLRENGLSRKDICFEIANGNTDLLMGVPGIGPKAAYRIVEELRTKSLQSFDDTDTNDADVEQYAEVIKELESFGFIKSDIIKALSTMSIDAEMRTTDILQAVIQALQ